ncbi:Hypothetical predicted protein [Mytilus galloprovincialis]|uniref:C-type lectin domain-containing protein n=1 Tax=Mytilus galloprovincialis TaxID=29158 RepID=A0A8B6H815_MYTGA|nr:Hypothetical predicted protein [Mytilus galloprovincialis]
MPALFLEYASVPVEQKVFHVKKLSGLIGHITENAAMTDHVANVILKAPCVPETSQSSSIINQTSSVNCYYTSGPKQVSWNTAADNCASTDGAYLWRPNTEQEANAVQNELNIHVDVWTGANDIDNDGNFTFAIENGSLSFNDLPFGEDSLENPVSLNLKHSEHLQLGARTIDVRNPWNKEERVMQTAAKEEKLVNWKVLPPENFKQGAGKEAFRNHSSNKGESVMQKVAKGEQPCPELFVCDGIFVDCIVSKHLHHRTSQVSEDKDALKTTDALSKLVALTKVVRQGTMEDLITKMQQIIDNTDEDLAFRYILGYSRNSIDNVDVLHQLLIHAIKSKNINCAKAIAWEITRRFSSTVLITQYHDIWPAFQCVCKTKNNLEDVSCSANMSNIVIVAEVQKGKTVLFRIDSFHGIQIIYKEFNGQSKEAMCIVKQVDGLKGANTHLTTIKGVSSEDAKGYFANHSKLSMFSKSHLKSKGFGHKNQIFECVPCIQLFCRAKGLLPIGESHFPVQINSIQTDILEGYPKLNVRSDIRIGAQILVPKGQVNKQAGINTEEIIPPVTGTGTVGGFLRYLGEDAFLTCAHVICDWESLIRDKSGIDIHDNPVNIFCPCVNSLGKMFPCGKLAGLAFPPDQGMGSSVDAAIVKIDQALARSFIDVKEQSGI